MQVGEVGIKSFLCLGNILFLGNISYVHRKCSEANNSVAESRKWLEQAFKREKQLTDTEVFLWTSIKQV